MKAHIPLRRFASVAMRAMMVRGCPSTTRWVPATYTRRVLASPLVPHSGVVPFDHLARMPLGAWRSRARAWCRSDRAVPSGIEAAGRSPHACTPRHRATRPRRCRSFSVDNAPVSLRRNSADSAGSRKGDAIVSARASASRTFLRRVMSSAAFATIRFNHAPNAWSGKNRSSARNAWRKPSWTASSASSCVNTIARATAYARR